jgi:hypothetical protein
MFLFILKITKSGSYKMKIVLKHKF